MRDAFRKSVFAVPFGCLVAIAAHFVRFGEEHAFGGRANEALVSGAVIGTLVIAGLILYAFLTGGTTTTTGTIAFVRARRLVPGTPSLLAVATTIYYGIESLEGNGIELGLPTLVLAAFALLVAYGLNRLTAIFSFYVADLLRHWRAFLGRRERSIWHLALDVHLVHSPIALAARHFGRAPPNGQRSPIAVL